MNKSISDLCTWAIVVWSLGALAIQLGPNIPQLQKPYENRTH